MTSAPPPATATPWVELRVHGVSGTPVEDCLGLTPTDPAPVLAVPPTDPRGAFWRRADAAGRPLPPDPDGRVVEAYHWGGYTEGRGGQGLWIVLAPFGVVNAAQFMLPPAENSPWWHAVSGACLRMLAVLLTCVGVLSASYVVMDRLAWQLAAGRGSAPFGWLAAAAVVPVAGVLWLRTIGNVRGAGRNPALDVDPAPGKGHLLPGGREDVRSGGVGTGLGSSYFYVGSSRTRARTDAPALRWLHVAVSVALTALLAVWPAADQDLPGGRPTQVVAIVVLSVLALVMLLLGDPEELSSRAPGADGVTPRFVRLRRWWHDALFFLAPALAAVAGVVLVAAVEVNVHAFVGHRPATLDHPAMPGIDGVATVLLSVGVVALVVLFVATSLLGRHGSQVRRDRSLRPYVGGRTASLAAGVGVFLGLAYAGGVATVADTLVNLDQWLFAARATRGRFWDALLTVPPIIGEIEFAWCCTVVATVVLAAVVVLGGRSTRREMAAAAERDFARIAADVTPGAFPKVATAMFAARLKNLIPVLFGVYAGLGVVLTVLAALDLHAGLWWFEDFPEPVRRWFLGLGALVLAAMALLVGVVAYGASRLLSWRRGANVVWDVISFWPRSVHPFVPGAYSQFVVAELRRRISTLVQEAPPGDGVRVVVGGHSQGSLISLAALAWVPPAQRERVAFVSFGSQIRQMFARAFPAYVNPAVVAWTRDNYRGRWVNLYRDTDHLAGPVLSWDHRTTRGDGTTSFHWPDEPPPPEPTVDLTHPVTGTRQCGPDWRLLDPRAVTPELQPLPGIGGDRARDVLHRHSDYWTDPDWPRAVATVRAGGADGEPTPPPPPR